MATIVPNADRWIVRPRPQPRQRLRLFCFPYAGGGASIYRTWPNTLPAEVEIDAIQLPGRETRLREPPYTRLAPMIEALAQVLSPHLATPFAFFGHSMGARIGFELARLLRERGQPGPLHLFVSGCTAPQVPDPDPPIHDLPEPEFIDELRRLNGTPEEVLGESELRALMIPLLRADFEVNETYTYVPGPPLDCPISAFGGLGDPMVSQADIAAWQQQTRAAYTLRMFPGDHFFLRSAQPTLLRVLAQDLARLI